MAELDPLFVDGLANNASGQTMRQGFAPLQAGVYQGTDCQVTAGSGTRELLVAPGLVFVQGSTPGVFLQGLYACRNDASKSSTLFEAGGVPAPDATNPRVDSVIAQAWDTAADGSGLRKWRLAIAAGTPTAGTQITGAAAANYRQGAPGGPGGPVLPASSVILADAVTRPGMTTYPAVDIIDRRPWARGAHASILDTSGDKTLATWVPSASNYIGAARRLECSGGKVRVVVSGLGQHVPSAAGQYVIGRLYMDGALVSASTRVTSQAAVTYYFGVQTIGIFELTPAAGSHLFQYAAGLSGVAGAQSGTISANTGDPLTIDISEDPRVPANNGTS